MQRLDMKLWLYDDTGWPSGGTCGRIVRENPQLARQSLERDLLEPECGSVVKAPEDCLAGFVYRGDTHIGRIKPGGQTEIKEYGMRIEIYYVKKESDTLHTPSQPDLLNPKATEEFIKINHETYKKALGDYFGDVVPLIVSDEPGAGNPPWTDNMDIEFEKDKGYDIKEFLPAIFQNGEEGKNVRIDFFDWWSKRFSEAFFGHIQKWCKENSLLYIGHLGGVDLTIGSRIYGFGHVLRILRKFDIPGVDTIWKQVHPGKKGVIKIKWLFCKENPLFRHMCGSVYQADCEAYFNEWEGSTVMESGCLMKNIEPIISIKPKNKHIRVCKRILDNGNLYFITNENSDEVCCTAEFHEANMVVRIDPETGL